MDNLQHSTINFLRVRKRQITAQEVVDRKYAIWMSYLFAGILVILLFVWGVDYFFTSQISKVQAQTKNAEAGIARQKNVEEELFILAEKLSFISDNLKAKEKKREAIAFFTKNFSTAETSLKDMTFDNEGILQFQLFSNDIFVLQKTMSALSSEAVTSQFNSVSVGEIYRDSDGIYRMQVIVVIITE